MAAPPSGRSPRRRLLNVPRHPTSSSSPRRQPCRRCCEPHPLALAALAACSDQQPAQPDAYGALAPYYPAGEGRGVAGQYIVVMQDGQDAGAVMRMSGVQARHRYAGGMEGFAGRLSPAQLHVVRRAPGVAFVEQDSYGSVMVQDTHPIVDRGLWGLDRIDQRDRPLSGAYVYGDTGAGCTCTCWTRGEHTHPSSADGQRGPAGVGYGGNGPTATGTARTWPARRRRSVGVASGQTVGVRVTDCYGDGEWSEVIAGIDWVTAHAQKSAVANMSLGGGSRRPTTPWPPPWPRGWCPRWRPATTPPMPAPTPPPAPRRPSPWAPRRPPTRGRRSPTGAPAWTISRRAATCCAWYTADDGHRHAQRHLHGGAPRDGRGRAVPAGQPHRHARVGSGWLSTYATANRVGGNDTGVRDVRHAQPPALQGHALSRRMVSRAEISLLVAMLRKI